MLFFKVIIILIAIASVGLYATIQYPNISPKINEFLKKPGLQLSISKPFSTKISEKTYIPKAQKPAPAATTTYLPDISDAQIPSGFTRSQLSLYFKKIRISSASYSSSVKYPSKIRMSSSLSSKDSSVNITGWQIKSNHGEIIIPQAIEIYYPDSSSKPADIYFSASQYADIYNNKSASGTNFRINKCLGYLENTYDFNPSLSKSCPRAYDDKSEITNLAGYCQSYIMSLSSCEIPSPNKYNSFPGTDDGNACRAYLSKISYGTCFNKHRSDSNFLSNEWRIWIDQKTILDSQHDRLRLYDKNGLLVDEYIY